MHDLPMETTSKINLVDLAGRLVVIAVVHTTGTVKLATTLQVDHP